MKKTIAGFLLSLALASLLHALPAGALSYPFTLTPPPFKVDPLAAGDSLTIQEVIATSPTLAAGTTVVVRGAYTLQSAPLAVLSVGVTAAAGTGSQSRPASSYVLLNAGSGLFELELPMSVAGYTHLSFGLPTGGSSFDDVYFVLSAGTPTTPSGFTPTSPATPSAPSTGTGGTPPIDTSGVTSVPFATRSAQFRSGDSITIQQVLSTSPNLAPGDTVLVRGTYTLQSSSSALLAISLTANAPGSNERNSSSSHATVNAGSGTYELAYQVQQPGALHLSFYGTGTDGSSFGGIYFQPSGSSGSTSSGSVSIVSPSTNTGLLGNLSVRSVVSPGDGALISGVVIADRERYVLLRAVGPSLSAFGVSGVLAKPLLTVYDSSGAVIASAGSWTANFSATQRAGIELLSSSVGAFALTPGSDDAVLHLRLTPGAYTIKVSSANGQSGAALMEVYASSTFTLPAQ